MTNKIYILALVVVSFSSCSRKSAELEEMLLYERLAADRSWESLAEKARSNYLGGGDEFDANWYHLAQAYRGRQTEDLFRVPEKGVQDLIFFPKEKNGRDVRMAHCYFAMGIMTGAENIAWNSLFSPSGMDYDMLRMIAQVELMRGNGKVADKYIRILLKTRKYRSWAENAAADPEILRGRRCSPLDKGFLMLNSPLDNLMQVVDANPSDSLAMQYALSWLLLAKDVESILGIIKRHPESPALHPLPTPVKEAVILYADFTQEERLTFEDCMSLGVTDDLFIGYSEFKETFMSGDRLALSAFRNTFWYYFANSLK